MKYKPQTKEELKKLVEDESIYLGILKDLKLGTLLMLLI